MKLVSINIPTYNSEETIEKCIRCGLCKSLCPVFRVIREEQLSPRGKAIILDSDNYEKIVYDCTLCKACETECPVNLELCEGAGCGRFSTQYVDWQRTSGDSRVSAESSCPLLTCLLNLM